MRLSYCLQMILMIIRWMSPAALDLAEQLLAFDPSQRVTALQAMNTPYFTKETPSASRPVGYVSFLSLL
jgi:CTD kinase subunit alpha